MNGVLLHFSYVFVYCVGKTLLLIIICIEQVQLFTVGYRQVICSEKGVTFVPVHHTKARGEWM